MQLEYIQNCVTSYVKNTKLSPVTSLSHTEREITV